MKRLLIDFDRASSARYCCCWVCWPVVPRQCSWRSHLWRGLRKSPTTVSHPNCLLGLVLSLIFAITNEKYVNLNTKMLSMVFQSKRKHNIVTAISVSDSKYREAELIVSACAHALFILLLIINIVFSVGVAFRHFRILCCGQCFGDYSDDVYDHYAKKDKHYDIRF